MHKKKSTEKILILVLAVLLLADFSYSFMQYAYSPLDGDLPVEMASQGDFEELVNDPFGLKCFINGIEHANPNRYLGHSFFRIYFDTIPQFFRLFTNRISSLYFSAGLFKILVHIAFVFSCVKLIFRKVRWEVKSLMALLLTSVVIQASGGFYHQIGFIDKSITYTFYYAFPAVLLIVFFDLMISYLERSNLFKLFCLFLIGLVVCFLGPLNCPVLLVLISSTMLVLVVLDERTLLRKIFQSKIKWVLIFVFILSLYSLYLEKYNSLNQASLMPISERFVLLAEGVFKLLTQKIAGPFLVLSAFGLGFFMRRTKREVYQKLRPWVFSLSLFCFLYLLLLPLGGYKVSRPLMVRYDTFIPVFICIILLIIMFLNGLFKHHVKFVGLYVLVALVIFSFSEKPEYEAYECQRRNIENISSSVELEVRLTNSCNVLTWEVIQSSEESAQVVEFLSKHGIAASDKRFRHTIPSEE